MHSDCWTLLTVAAACSKREMMKCRNEKRSVPACVHLGFGRMYPLLVKR